MAEDCTVALPNGEGEAPNREGAEALALGAAADCANANGDGEGEAADAAWEAGAPKEGVEPKGEGGEEAPPKRPLLPNVDEPKPPPEEAAAVAAPPKPNEGVEDAPPNKLPPAGTLPAAAVPNAGAEDVPNENDVGVPDDDALNPVKPDIVNSTDNPKLVRLSLTSNQPIPHPPSITNPKTSHTNTNAINRFNLKCSSKLTSMKTTRRNAPRAAYLNLSNA